MGVVVKNLDAMLAVGNTTDLVTWISKVRMKKTNLRRQRKKNLLAEAVLSSALTRAEAELRDKQQARLLRWQLMKDNLTATVTFPAANMPLLEDGWDSKTSQHLSSLDNFMTKLKEVKRPLER